MIAAITVYTAHISKAQLINTLLSSSGTKRVSKNVLRLDRDFLEFTQKNHQ